MNWLSKLFNRKPIVIISGNGFSLPRLINLKQLDALSEFVSELEKNGIKVEVNDFYTTSQASVDAYNTFERKKLRDSLSEYAIKTGEFDPPPEAVITFSRDISKKQYQLIQNASNSLPFSQSLGPAFKR